MANAAAAVLKQQISLPMSDLIRETARLFGFQRTGSQVEQFVQEGIELFNSKGCMVIEGEHARLK